MKILHVNKYLYRRGGAEVYMQDVAELQTAVGHEVAFWGMAHADDDPVVAGRYADRLAPFIELEPPPPGVLPRLRAGARMVWSEASRRALAGVLDDFRPDIAHLHNVYHQLSPSILQALRARGIPIVMTLHDYKLACPSYQFLAGGRICTRCLDGHFRHAVQTRCKGGSRGASALLAVESRIHRSTGAWSPVHLFISPSRFLAGKMAAAGVFPERMNVLGNFVDVRPLPVKDVPGGPLVYAGRLAAEKGIDVLIRAVGGLPPDAELQVAGDGPERAALERLADEAAPGRVQFRGRLGKEDLLALLRSASVAVVPSRWHENMPMAVLEAFGCGLPVVATDLGGLPELVTPGVDGAIVAPEDPAALAEALAELLADPARTFAMGLAGRRKVAADFAPEQHLSRLLALYAEAATAAGRPLPVGSDR